MYPPFLSLTAQMSFTALIVYGLLSEHLFRNCSPVIATQASSLPAQRFVFVSRRSPEGPHCAAVIMRPAGIPRRLVRLTASHRQTYLGHFGTAGAQAGHGTACSGKAAVSSWRGRSNSISEDGASASFSFSFLYAAKPDAPLPLARRSV